MQGNSDRLPGQMPVPSWRMLAALALVFVGLRLWLQLGAAPFPDESYYWLWGQHPALSYFDHPPLQAWVLGAMAQVMPHGLFGLRFVTWVTTGIVLGGTWHLLRRAGVGPRPAATVLLVMMASPLMQVMTAITFHDHLLLVWLTLAMVAAVRALEPVRAGQGPAPGWMIATGAFVGAAALTKLNGLLFGAALVMALALVPKWRGVFGSVWLYLSMAIALAFLTPVLLWNLQNKSEGLKFTFADRLAFDPSATFAHLTPFVVGSILMLSPLLVWPMIRAARGAVVRDDWHRIAIAAFLTSTGIWLAVTPVTQVLYYWNLVAWIALMPFAALALRSRLALGAHLLWGVVFGILVAVNSAHVPLATLWGDKADEETSLLYGWNEVAAVVAQAQADHGVDFVLAAEHRHGAQLAFALNNPDVMVLSPRRSQFDLWPLPGGAVGGDAIIVTEARFALRPDLAARFAKITQIAVVPVSRAGQEVATFTVHLGQGFLGRP